jgi:uracil-DNA glycosylase
MTWTQEQRAMLAEMGVRVWQATPQVTMAEPSSEGPMKSVVKPSAQGLSVREPEPSLAYEAPQSIQRQIHAQVPSTAPIASQAPSSAHVSHMHWHELRAAVAQCTACKLCESRTQTVFGTGHEQADWLIVGEAPGEQEDLQGEPFVGKSGQLLDNMLRAMGLGRGTMPSPEKQVYIANTIKCRPPSNRNPLPEELAQCEPYLIRQVALLKPKIILAMGRFAVQSLLRRSDPIGRLRGQVHSYQGVPLIVTYHPAYLLRNPEDKAKAWDDLCLAMASYQ